MDPLFKYFFPIALTLLFLIGAISARYTRKRRRALWGQLAAAYQGELQLRGGTGGCYKDRASFSYRGITLELWLRKKTTYRNRRFCVDIYQMMTARLPLDPSFRASVKRDRRLFRARRPTDIQVDDERFDPSFLIEGSPPQWLAAALHHAPELRALQQRSVDFEVELRGGLLTISRFQESQDLQDLEEHLRLMSLYISALTEAALPPQQGW